jgi:hypothetical protein
MVVARSARALMHLFGSFISLVRLSPWLSVWVNFRLLFGSTSRGVRGVSLYGLMLRQCSVLSLISSRLCNGGGRSWGSQGTRVEDRQILGTR